MTTTPGNAQLCGGCPPCVDGDHATVEASVCTCCGARGDYNDAGEWVPDGT